MKRRSLRPLRFVPVAALGALLIVNLSRPAPASPTASGSGGGAGLDYAVTLIDQYPGACNADPHAGVISANDKCTAQLASMRKTAPHAVFLLYMKGPICWALIPCSQFSNSDFARTTSGSRLHPTYGYPNANFIMDPRSTAWRNAVDRTCQQWVAKGWDGCYTDLEGPSSWNDCLDNGSSKCDPASPDGTASDGYTWSRDIIAMQKAITAGLPSAKWESNGIGSAAAYVAGAPSYSTRGAPEATNVGSTAEGYTSDDFNSDMALLADTGGVFPIAKGEHMTDLASFLEGVQPGGRYGWSWCGKGATRDDCALADSWLVRFASTVSVPGGPRYTRDGLTERDYGNTTVVYNNSGGPITFHPRANAMLPDGTEAPGSVSLAPRQGYIAILAGGSPPPSPTSAPPTQTPTPPPSHTPVPTDPPTPPPTPPPSPTFSTMPPTPPSPTFSTLPPVPPLISHLDATSMPRDGHSSITFDLRDRASVDVAVEDGHGQVIAHPVDHTWFDAGPITVDYYGYDNGGRVEPGWYTVVVTAAAANGATERRTTTLRVT